MPVNYQLPPWAQGVTPAEFGRQYGTGLHLGVQVGEESARMVQESQRAAAQFEMEQQRLQQQREVAQMHADAQAKIQEQENARQTQQIEMTKAYHDQMTSLKMSELQNAKARFTMQATQAAQKFAAQEQYRQRVAGGEDASKVLLELGPAMGGEGSAMGAAMKSREGMRGYGPIKSEDLGSGVKAVYREGSPGLHIVAPQKSHELTASGLAAIAKAIPDLQSAVRLGGTNSVAAKILPRIQRLLDESDSGGAARGGNVRKVRKNPKTGKFELVPDEAQAQPGPEMTAPGDEIFDEDEE